MKGALRHTISSRGNFIMANPFVHFELNTPDLAKAKAFYGALFGWQFQDNDMGPMGVYSTFKPDDGPGGGMMSMPMGNPGWLSYVGVKDINQSTDQARSLGATILLGPQEIPNIGWMTMLQDPTGCTIAIFQPK
jgi:predicted enzyme related to lactoylglutathione lyase